MTEDLKKVTRGCGYLERFLSKQRADIAFKLIGENHAYEKERILDIGCGTQPYFLTRTRFAKRYGLENFSVSQHDQTNSGIHLIQHDVEGDKVIPFEDSFFDVVTMLAVFEHILPERLPEFLDEICRILKPEGTFVITTPAGWTDGLLRFLANLNLVSSEEIDEHKDAYTHDKIRAILNKTNFRNCQTDFGYFELGMNIWVRIKKKR